MESFYVTATSNASLDIFPKNSLVNFGNQLPQDLDVNGYKVALQTIFLDNKYGNIPNSILGTRNHFLLFHNNNQNAELVGVCDITDFTMSPNAFVRTVNENLNKKGNRVLLGVSQKKIQIIMTKCVLLVHRQINRYLQFSEEKQNYLGEEYVVLNSEGGTQTFLSRKDFPVKTFTPTVIKVQLEEMQQNLSQVRLVQDLALIKVEEASYPFFHVCKRKEYFKLNRNQLSSLSIRLVDAENYPIHAGKGQPTLLKLQFKKFPMSSFVLRLSSLESNNIFSDNCSSSFRIQLQQPLDVSRNWEVALSSIYLPSKIDAGSTLSAKNCYISISAPGTNFKKIPLHDLTDFSAEGFVAHCETKISSAFPQEAAPISLTLLENGEIQTHFERHSIVQISGMLAYLLERAPTPDLQEFWVMEGQQGTKMKWGKINFKRAQPHVVCVHCNFITPLMVGNTFGQVLQIIPYYDNTNVIGNVMKYEAQHLDFLPMSMNDKAVLQFEMCNTGSSLITFKNNKAEILLTLVFREKM